MIKKRLSSSCKVATSNFDTIVFVSFSYISFVLFGCYLRSLFLSNERRNGSNSGWVGRNWEGRREGKL